MRRTTAAHFVYTRLGNIYYDLAIAADDDSALFIAVDVLNLTATRGHGRTHSISIRNNTRADNGRDTLRRAPVLGRRRRANAVYYDVYRCRDAGRVNRLAFSRVPETSYDFDTRRRDTLRRHFFFPRYSGTRPWGGEGNWSGIEKGFFFFSRGSTTRTEIVDGRAANTPVNEIQSAIILAAIPCPVHDPPRVGLDSERSRDFRPYTIRSITFERHTSRSSVSHVARVLRRAHSSRPAVVRFRSSPCFRGRENFIESYPVPTPVSV